ncbi:MAG: phosphotransferase, partial [Akkermansiaceae bacterium]|nr:phosphotransferase [Akkermansiaceae bacterium]
MSAVNGDTRFHRALQQPPLGSLARSRVGNAFAWHTLVGLQQHVDLVCIACIHMQVLTHVAERLKDLHAAGYVHRDIKPGNIMWLPRKNRWTLIDFGCAARIGSKALWVQP